MGNVVRVESGGVMKNLHTTYKMLQCEYAKLTLSLRSTCTEGIRYFSFLESVQTGSGVHPVVYSVGKVFFPGV
jgi:hypothetical protein